MTRAECYLFQPGDGRVLEVLIVGHDGPDRSLVRLSNGIEATVSNFLLSKDPARMKALRMAWEEVKALEAPWKSE